MGLLGYSLALASLLAADRGDVGSTWEMTQAELEAVGLGQSRGDPVPWSQTLGASTDSTAAEGDPAVIFVNFDGATLSAGPDDSRANITTIGELAGPFDPYGDDGSKRAAVVQAVMQDWMSYNVLITDERPESGDYVMNMVGPSDVYGAGTLGIAPLDCGDSRTRNNITFAFHSAGDNHNASTTATTISQEVAHSFGLEHVDEPADIMNPSNAGGDPSFRDDCLGIVGETQCPAQHEEECDSPSLQNSHRELLELFGPPGPGASGPSIRIVSPADGDEFEPGTSFDIRIEPDDDFVVREIELYVDGTLTDTDTASPYGWTANNVVEGEYEIYAQAEDEGGAVAISNRITVYVGQATLPNTDDGSLPPNYGHASAGDLGGCGCKTGHSPSPFALFACVWLLGLRRRRG